MSEVRAWDGRSYDRVSGPMQALGQAVLDRLELRGDETVLDAGCGSGRLTEQLIERVPRGKVIAVDVSESMVAAARERLGSDADVRRMDLLELEVGQPVDAIFSTATFHWIADHDALFRRLHGVLSSNLESYRSRPGHRISLEDGAGSAGLEGGEGREGRRLVAQCGGEGNITTLRGRAAVVMERDPYAEHFATFAPPWNYASAAETEARLRNAGFTTVECWLAPAPTEPEHPREFLSTIVLGPHVQHLHEDLREPFMDEVMAELGEPVIFDYVRLNIDAMA